MPPAIPRATRPPSPIQLLSKASLRKNATPMITATMPTLASQLPPRIISQSTSIRSHGMALGAASGAGPVADPGVAAAEVAG